ncbi:MAG: hypothetical protein R3F24_08705 [Gammaproteobacteria bacterium]
MRGLGVKQFFDPGSGPLPGPDLAGGAIRGWDRRRNACYFSMIQAWPNATSSTSSNPWSRSRPAQNRKILLHGGEGRFFSRHRSRRQHQSQTHKFEGILPNLERRYRETDSSMVREELSEIPEHPAYPDCLGTRRLNYTAA